MLLRPALDTFDVEYATTFEGFAARERISRVHILPDSNRHRPLRTIACFIASWRLIRATRPDFVISTGALPGLICAIVGRMHGARTIWIDSIANSEKVSMSGWCARWFSGLWLTQWEHLARPKGPSYDGALL